MEEQSEEEEFKSDREIKEEGFNTLLEHVIKLGHRTGTLEHIVEQKLRSCSQILGSVTSGPFGKFLGAAVILFILLGIYAIDKDFFVTILQVFRG